MFDIGFSELIFLALMGLIFLGPKRLPKVAAQLGRWVGQARRMSRTLMYQLRQEVDLDDPRPFSARRPAETARAKANAMHQPSGGGKKDDENDKAETSSTDDDGSSKPSE